MSKSNLPEGLSMKVLRRGSIHGKMLFLISDTPLNSDQEKLAVNFFRVADQITIVSPEAVNYDITSEDAHISHDFTALLVKPGDYIIAFGKIAPLVIRHYNDFRNASRIVFINPVYNREIAGKMASIETPCLVITSTPGNLDHNPDSVKYHDLIAGSRIQYIRGVSGNPLYLRFTQSFNAIQSFLQNE